MTPDFEQGGPVWFVGPTGPLGALRAIRASAAWSGPAARLGSLDFAWGWETHRHDGQGDQSPQGAYRGQRAARAAGRLLRASGELRVGTHEAAQAAQVVGQR